RLNLIIYLTEEWEDAWGGSIQLHKDPYLPPSQDEIAVVTPLFNRCVIFETNEYSWHGFPRINLPEEKRHLSRKSFALYYYTVSRPAEELGSEHSTIYVEQHLPETLAPGEALSGEEVQRIRDLVFTRDQHLKRLYGNIKQLNDELNDLKERFKLQAPPGVADEPAVEPGRDPSTGLPSPASVSESDDSDEQAEEHAVDRTLLDAQLQQRAQQIKLLEQQVHELKQSTSWRVTRPLRRLKTLLARQ
ncbi:MAG: 2OG-Fe(II) oxygenase, partial [Pseudomonadota bacterium]